MSFNLLTVAEDAGGLIPDQSLQLPHQHFLVYAFGVEVEDTASLPSPTYLLGLTISFAVTGSQQLQAEQLLEIADLIQITVDFGVSSSSNLSSWKLTPSPQSPIALFMWSLWRPLCHS